MRVIISVILLLAICGCGAETTSEAPKTPSEVSSDNKTTSEGPVHNGTTSEEPSGSKTTSKAPDAVTSPEESTETTTLIALNPNLTIQNFTEKYKNLFVSTMNKHRQKHLVGRNAYVWSWDDSLQDSAAKRAENCSLTAKKFSEGDDYRELILTGNQWKHTINIPEKLQKALLSMIYLKGIARVGCVQVTGCDKKQYVFCHFSTSLKSTSPGFEIGSTECVFDTEFQSLCQDLMPSTEPPTTKLFRPINPARKSSRSVFDLLEILGAFGVFLVV